MDMGGWDVIYASNITQLNKVLAQSSQELLPTFSYTNDAMGIAFSGTFGAWSIRPGGTANRINLQVPINQGVLNGCGYSNFSLNGVQPLLNVALTLMQSQSFPDEEDVVFDFKEITTDPSTAKDGDIYIANPDESGLLKKNDPLGIVSSILRDNLPKCFIANAEKISFIFASVLMEPDTQPWLKPKATSISYFESSDGKTQAIAIKTLTQAPWSSDGLPIAIDPSLLTAKNTLFYALSKAVFMQNLLLPSIPKSFGPDIKASSFAFNGPTQPNQQNNCTITNTENIKLPSVENAGTHYHPIITHFKMEIRNNQIVSTASGKFDVTGLKGAWVEFNNLQVVNKLSFDPVSQKIIFITVSETEPSVEQHIPWEYWFLLIGGLIGVIVGLIIKVVVTVIEDAVEDALKGEGDLSIVNIPLSTAVWAGETGFSATEVSLAEALVLRGECK